MTDQKLIDYLSNFITEERNTKFNSVLENRTKFFTVAVEDVYQLHNTSAVIRSCDVFGVQEVNIIEERNLKKIDREIAMGAQKWVDINRFNDSQSCIEQLKSQGYQIVATSPHKTDCDINDFNFLKKSCFVFGSEQNGLSEDMKNKADTFLKIPMYGFTESLNISVSAAIILQKATQELHNSTINWKLTQQEKLDIKYRWINKTLKSFEDVVKRYTTEND